MSTQVDRTYVRHDRPSASIFSLSGTNHRVSAFGFSDTGAAYAGLYINTTQTVTVTDCVVAGCGYAVWQFNSPGCSVSLAYSVQCRISFYISGTNNPDSVGPSTSFYAGYAWGVSNAFAENTYFYYNNGSTSATPFKPTVECADVRFYTTGLMSLGSENLTVKNTAFNDCDADLSLRADAYAFNTTFTSATLSSALSLGNATLFAQQINGDATLHGQRQGNNWKILTATDQRHTAADVSWKFSAISNNTYFGFNAPSLCVAQVACLANQQRTVSLWFRKDSASAAMRLRVKGGFVSGIGTDVVASMTVGANLWEELSIQFTPTVDCVVPVYAEFSGPSSSNGWVDDLTVA